MRALMLLPLAGLAFPALAADHQAARMETGFEVGALGLSAIDRGDWVTAERQLMAMRGVAADDPARLINLGRVYAATGRPEMAAAAWQKAIDAPRHYKVELSDGTVSTTDQVARKALAQYSFAAR